MGEIIGCIGTAHAPQLLMPPEKWHELPDRVKDPGPERPELAKELTLEAKQAKFARCMAALALLRQKLDEWAPDALILIGDDQRENIFEDNTPPFTFYIEREVYATLHFRYFGESPLAQRKLYKVHREMAHSLLDGLMEAGFDPAWSRKTRLEAGLGHAFGRVLHFLMPERNYPIVPIMVNTYYPPAPTAKRCLAFGKALAEIIRGSGGAESVVVIASGGLSHTKIDEELDRQFIAALKTHDSAYLGGMPSSVLIEGTSELRNWIIAAAVAGTGITMIDYVPCYRTARGVGCAMGFGYWQ
ncbi:MAG TPA: hypothetical protein VNL14_11480 [Candidatus Acidoferrales bacterium]|nr:hypothetical protein [Candidatus Acidoferrales bacterium]